MREELGRALSEVSRDDPSLRLFKRVQMQGHAKIEGKRVRR